MYWKDAEDIAIALVEAHPEVDPLDRPVHRSASVGRGPSGVRG